MQGMATGIIQPLIMVTVFQVFPEERRGFALGIYSMGLVLAIALGPPVGGVALELLNWRYIFWLPLPLLLIALPLGMVFMPSVRKSGGQAFDWVGYILNDGADRRTAEGLDIRPYPNPGHVRHILRIRIC